MERLLVDTSAVYALLDRDDARHELAVERLREMQRARVEPLLTNFVVAECHALLLARLGHSTARRWLTTNIWRVERVSAADELHAHAIVRDCSDKSFSYTDATSFAVMARLGLDRAFAFDRHFVQYGLKLFA